MTIVNPGFYRKRKTSDRLPPGQYLEDGFPVLSLGPTPSVAVKTWQLKIRGLADPLAWTFDELKKLPQTEFFGDIHCVTKWSKFDTPWSGVSIDEIVKRAGVNPKATHVIAHSADDYTTNLPIIDVTEGKAMIALAFDGKPIPAEHGGPARLLVPHLYFWKSAKWLTALEFLDHDQPGFWEVRGYHNYGDPWREQRYEGD